MAARLTSLAVGVVLAVGLAGCGSAGTTHPTASPSAPPPGSPVVGHPASGEFGGTDVMFLQMMVPHHGQGLDLVRLAKDRATRSEVRILAAAIEVTQAAEVQTMSAWLRAWGQPPTADPAAHAAHGGMPGTSAVEIASLAGAADFERAFLNMMIAHQDDAIQLARMELASGTNPQARDLARQIDLSRSAQVKQMLAYLPPP